MDDIYSIARHYQQISFSQCGEDLIVDYIFRLRNISKPSYFDIGAYHPYWLSNTALFYHKGCRGINVEANPSLIEDFERCRPNDINLNVGVHDRPGILEFYVMLENTLSTFSKKERNLLIGLGKLLSHTININVTTVNTIVQEYFNNVFPDFLSIDVEGCDMKVLKSMRFDGKSRPKVICIEAAEYSLTGAGPRRSELIDFLSSKGYYEYANTNLNAIMVENNFWFN